jgi:hypothetical protein
MPDLFKVKRNVAKMVSMGAPESDIDSYITQEGTSIDEVRNISLKTPEVIEKPPDMFTQILDNIGGKTIKDASKTAANLITGGNTHQDFYRERVAPIVHGSSTLTFGIPKAVAESTGTKDIIYPEQKTFSGKMLRGGAEAVGFLGGGAIKTGLKVGEKLLAKKAGEGLLRKAGRMGLEGATAGLLQAPEGSLGEGMAKRPEQAATWGALGASMPFAGKAVGKTGEILAKSGRWVAKNIGGITDATVATIKRLGADRVFEPIKASADYISQNLTPKVYQKIDNIVQSAHNAYNKAVNSVPQGKSINIRPAIEKAGDELKQLGLITEKGLMTELGSSEIARDSVYGKLLDFYKSADAISGVKSLQGKELTQGQMIKVSKAAKETLVNKKQFLFFRDKLNALYKGKPSDIDVSGVRDAFYKSGEDAGMKGLNVAKSLENNAFDIADKVDLDKITRDLIKAKNPQYTKQIENEYKKILGEEGFKDIWDDLMAHFANIDFNLVSETPGAGGGMYPSKTKFLQTGIANTTKKYYQSNIPEKIKNIKRFTGEVASKFPLK